MGKKVFEDAADALSGLLSDGITIAAGGFGLCGIPETLIDVILRSGVRNITAISNNAGVEDYGLGLLLRSRQIVKMIASYVGENKEFERQFLSSELQIEFNPQGTLAERLRAGGAGIAGFYTRTGVGTVVARGKETREFAGEMYLFESGLTADLGIVKAWKGDHLGNLVYRKSARNFNPLVASAGRITVAEVEHLVEPGSIDPDQIHTPGIYVDRIVPARLNEKRIERPISRTKEQLE
jgi:3-oxoacid CoA-transferase subunit A